MTDKLIEEIDEYLEGYDLLRNRIKECGPSTKFQEAVVLLHQCRDRLRELEEQNTRNLSMVCGVDYPPSCDYQPPQQEEQCHSKTE